MSKTYRIEELITIVDERNSDNKDLPLLGINLSKSFFPSVANVIGTDLSRYKVIRKGRFACNMMHVGRDMKVPVALYLEEKEAIISPAYPMFTVSDENIIVPEYLMLFFKNSEFDREAGFYASAGIRGGFDWEDFCNITLSVPSIEEQRRIVSEYQTVERRIQNNELLIKKLEETAQAIYHHTFVEGVDENNLPEGWRKGCLGDVAELNPPRKAARDSMPCVEMSDLSQISAYPSSINYKEYNGGMKFMNGDTIMARITPCLENGKAAFVNFLEDKEVAFGSTEYIVFCSKSELPPEFFYFMVRNKDFINFAISNMNGTSGRQRANAVDIAKYSMLIPNKETCAMISLSFATIMKNIKICSRELTHLRTLLSLLTSKLA